MQIPVSTSFARRAAASSRRASGVGLGSSPSPSLVGLDEGHRVDQRAVGPAEQIATGDQPKCGNLIQADHSANVGARLSSSNSAIRPSPNH